MEKKVSDILLDVVNEHSDVKIDLVDETASGSIVESKESASADKQVNTEVLEIYTDGACSGNPGPGGWAAVMIYGEHRKEVSGGEKLTTNNKMELLAAINGLKMVTREDVPIKIFTDSLYLKNGITDWIKAWKNKNFKDVKNSNLWQELDEIANRFKIEWNWVKAHNGNVENERADALARQEAKGLASK